MSRRGVRRRGTARRGSGAVADYVGGSPDNGNNTTYTFSGFATGADAADRMFVLAVEVRASETTELSGVTLGGNAMSKIASVNGNGIQLSLWKLGAGVLPTGSTATLAINAAVTRANCRVDMWRIVGQASDTPHWSNPVVNGGAGTSIDVSPPSTFPDGATVAAIAAPASNPTTSWTGVSADYDTATEASNARVSGGHAVGLPAALSASLSASSTNLMGVAVHIR